MSVRHHTWKWRLDLRGAAKGLRVMLALGCVSAAGCATSRSTWSGVPESPSPEPLGTISFANGEQAASFLAMPGDIVLLNLGSSRAANSIKQLGLFPSGLMDLLSLHDPLTTYLHAEFVVDIPDAGKLKTRGFYPFLKQFMSEMYDEDYALYRVTGFPDPQCRALRKFAAKRYLKIGYCGDYVAWCFDDAIYSWWNQIPGLQRFFVNWYPPEAIQTPDRLATSPQTRLVCTVRKGRLVYPTALQTGELLQQVHAGLAADHPAIQSHSVKVLDRLIQSGLVATNHAVQVPILRIRGP
jgi:hypothetical protein